MSLNSGETLQPFKALNQLIFDSSGNLIGIQNDRAVGNDLRIGGGSGVDGTFATLIATTALKLNSGATFDLYNTADQTTNFEKLRADWSSDVARLFTQYGGSASPRALRVGAATTASPVHYMNFGTEAPFLAGVVGVSSATITPLSRFSYTGNAASATQTFFSIAPTINQSGTAGYTALDINPTETATGSGTKLLQRWAVGGVTQALIGNTGGLQANGAVLINGVSFGATLGASDTILAREAANTLSLRNVGNAQTFRVYNTYTDASNYERGEINATASNFDIVTRAAGTGTNRNLRLYTTGGSATLQLGSNNSIRWEVNSSGHFLAEADNTYDIGASGANRPRNVYVANIVSCATVITGTTTVAGLGAVPAGRNRLFVSDSTVAAAGNFGAIVAGGGANVVPVYSDGTNWRIG